MKWLLLSLAISSVVLLPGCSLGRVEEAVRIQDLRTVGLVNQRPLRYIDSDSTRRLRVHASLNILPSDVLRGRILGHSAVDDGDTLQYNVDTSVTPPQYRESHLANYLPFMGTNLQMNFPRISGIVGLSWETGKYTMVTGDIQYASLEGRDYYGGSLGFALFKRVPYLGISVETGVSLNRIHYRLQYLKLTTEIPLFGSPEEYSTVVFGESDTYDQYADMYGAIEINTRVQQWPVNLYFRISTENQTLVSRSVRSSPSNILLEHTSTLAVFTPGVIVNAGVLHSIVVGVQFIHDSSMKAGDTWYSPMTTISIQY